MIDSCDGLFSLPTFFDDHATPICWSYGLGVESTVGIVRTLHEPGFRPPALRDDLSNLVVMVAQTGDEWTSTCDLVATYVLPLLRERAVRFVEVARAGPSAADGIVVLQDSRSPVRLHPDADEHGFYALSAEHRGNGVLPTLGGRRTCSAKSKGVPLDGWRARYLAHEPTCMRSASMLTSRIGSTRIPRLRWAGGGIRSTHYMLRAGRGLAARATCSACSGCGGRNRVVGNVVSSLCRAGRSSSRVSTPRRKRRSSILWMSMSPSRSIAIPGCSALASRWPIGSAATVPDRFSHWRWPSSIPAAGRFTGCAAATAPEAMRGARSRPFTAVTARRRLRLLIDSAVSWIGSPPAMVITRACG